MSEKNKISVRLFEVDDYETLCTFWQKHEWQPLPLVAMPSPYYLAECDGEIIAGEGLLLSKYNGIGMQEWLVSNPDANPRTVIKAIRKLDEQIEATARNEEVWALFTYCKQEGLAKLKKKFGYQETDRDMIHLIKPL